MFDKVNKPGDGAVTTLVIHKATAKSRITILNQLSALNSTRGVGGGVGGVKFGLNYLIRCGTTAA